MSDDHSNDLNELLRAHEARLGGAEPMAPGLRARLVARARRRAAARAWAAGAGALLLVAGLGVGAWALAGRSGPAPVPPAYPTNPVMTTEPPSPSPTAAVPTGPATTDALRAVYDNEAVWYGLGGLVPVDAPLETFPVESEPTDRLSCTDAQVAWLERHGRANTVRAAHSWLDYLRGVAEGPDRPYLADRSYTLSSVADPATPLTVSNLRVEGESVPRDRLRFQFGCVNGGIGGHAPDDQVVASVDGSPATYYVTPYEGTSTPPPAYLMPESASGSPFTVELAAGEDLRVDVLIDSGAAGDFVGQVVADVTIGDETYRSVLDEGYLQVGEPDLTTVYAAAGYGRLFCFTDSTTYEDHVAMLSLDQLLPYECTPHELADMVAAAAG